MNLGFSYYLTDGFEQAESIPSYKLDRFSEVMKDLAEVWG